MTSHHINVKRPVGTSICRDEKRINNCCFDRSDVFWTSRSIRTLQSDGPGHRSGWREIVAEKCSSKGRYRLATAGVVHVRAGRRRMSGSFAHSFRWVRRNNNNIIILLCKLLYYDSNVSIIIFICLLIIGVLALFVDSGNSMFWVWSIVV